VEKTKNLKKYAEIKVEWEDFYFNMSNSKRAELIEKVAKKYNVPKNKVTLVSKYIQTFTSNDGNANVSNIVLDTVLNPKKLHKTYTDFIGDKFKGQNTDKFFEIDKEIVAKMPPLENFDIRNRKYKILYIKGKNIFSFADFYRDYTKNNGLNIVYSDPANQGGKSKFTILPAFLLFGNKIKLNVNNVTFSNVFNSVTADKDAFIEGEIELDGNVYFLKRELHKTKSKVEHKFFLYKYDEKEGSDQGLRLPAINLTVKDAIQTRAAFENYIGTYEDYVFSSYYEYHNIDKWVHTKKTERYRLFCEYFGLGLLESKYKIANTMLNAFAKSSLLSKYSKEQVINDQLTLNQTLSDNQAEQAELTEKIDNLTTECQKIQSQINGLYEQKIPLDSKYESLDVDTLSTEIADILDRIGKADVYIDNLINSIPKDVTVELLESEIAKIQTEISVLEKQEIKIPFDLTERLAIRQLELDNVQLSDEEKQNEADAKKKVEDLQFNQRILENEIKTLKESLDNMVEIACKKCGHVENSKDDKIKIESNIALKIVELGRNSKDIAAAKEHLTNVEKMNIETLNILKKHLKTAIESINVAINDYKQEKIEIIQKNVEEKRTFIEKNRYIIVQVNNLQNANDKRTNLLDKVALLNTDIKKYNECQNAIESNQSLSKQIKGLETEFFSQNETLQDLKNKSLDFEKESAVIEHKINGNAILLTKLDEDYKYEQSLRLYVQVHGDDGLGKHIITSVLPQINQELAILMGGLCDFDLKISFDEKEIEFVIEKNNVLKDLYCGSGYETTMSCLALHYVNCRMSTLPLPNYLVMDEIFGRVNPDNIKNIINLLQKLCEIFDTIDIVTHTCTDEILATIDNHILIEKINDISKVNHK
jgi:DNA repair exonuclease SbcCD ATPase subunit